MQSLEHLTHIERAVDTAMRRAGGRRGAGQFSELARLTLVGLADRQQHLFKEALQLGEEDRAALETATLQTFERLGRVAAQQRHLGAQEAVMSLDALASRKLRWLEAHRMPLDALASQKLRWFEAHRKPLETDARRAARLASNNLAYATQGLSDNQTAQHTWRGVEKRFRLAGVELADGEASFAKGYADEIESLRPPLDELVENLRPIVDNDDWVDARAQLTDLQQHGRLHLDHWFDPKDLWLDEHQAQVRAVAQRTALTRLDEMEMIDVVAMARMDELNKLWDAAFMADAELVMEDCHIAMAPCDAVERVLLHRYRNNIVSQHSFGQPYSEMKDVSDALAVLQTKVGDNVWTLHQPVQHFAGPASPA